MRMRMSASSNERIMRRTTMTLVFGDAPPDSSNATHQTRIPQKQLILTAFRIDIPLVLYKLVIVYIRQQYHVV